MSPLVSHLRVPGPTPLPDQVREAGARQMVNHRGPEFKALLVRIVADLKMGFRTESDVLLLTASGTGALEAAAVNFLSPGDPVLAVSVGAFGDRFARIATRYGARVTKIDVPWGQGASVDHVTGSLEAMARGGHPARAVLVTHNETSTGVTNPMEALAAAARRAQPDALLIVDGISGVGAIPFEADAWDLDVVTTASQKSWMSPPGLAMVSVSERAWAAAERATMPRFYFDLALHRDALAKDETPWTPAISVAFALDAALRLIEAEGYPAIFARHAACAAATRAGIQALGFELFADRRFASDTVTAVRLPDDLPWADFNASLRARGLVLAGGQGPLAGQIFRIGHLGAVTVDEILAALEIIEATLVELGRPVERGVALQAADAAAAAVAVPAGA